MRTLTGRTQQEKTETQPFERILVVGAHPDDAEFHAGGLMISQAQRGSQIGILCLTDGSAGHQAMDRPSLALRRQAEAAAAARLIPATLEIWDVPDGELSAELENRQRLVVAIRAFKPDLLITHRPNDYHPDHRATGQLVQDACYLLRVPNVVPEVPALQHDPVVLSMADFFTRPAPFNADVVLPTDALLDAIVELLACHESQVFEWLPFMAGVAVEGDPRGWLRDFYSVRPAALARRFAPQHAFVEAFELSEYGRRMPAREIQHRLEVPKLA